MKRFLSGLFLSFLISGLSVLISCNNVTPKPPPPPNSWLVLLCKASDDTTEPHPPSYYANLFDKNQRDLFFDYFAVASNHTVDVSGTEVYGWFPMSVTTSEIGPTVRNNTTTVQRDQTARDCKASAIGGMAAMGFSVDPANFVGTITVINVPVDTGATGERSVVINGDPELSFWEHEMLHEWGPRLNHSWVTSPDSTSDHQWNHGGDVEYGDCWDIMSWPSCFVYRFPTSSGRQGPELQAVYRAALNWLPPGRSTRAGFGVSTTTLAPLSDPSMPGSLLLTVEFTGRGGSGSYLVEYREKSGFDRGIQGSAVLIREHRRGLTYLVVRSNGDAAWRQGDLFTDSANFISIRVDQITLGAATVTVNTTYSAGPVAAGEICGDGFHGEVRPCPAGLDCKAKRLGSGIQTVEWFCLP